MTYFDAPATFNLTVRDVGIPNDSCETAERIYTGDQVVISPPKRFGEYNPKFDYCGAGKYNLSDYNIVIFFLFCFFLFFQLAFSFFFRRTTHLLLSCMEFMYFQLTKIL